MMLRFGVLFSSLAGLAAYGAGPPAAPIANEVLNFRFGERHVEFIHRATEHVTVSATCFSKNAAPNCEAYAAVKRASLKGLKGEMHGGVEPGAVVCAQGLHAKVVLGVDDKSNENSFCQFNDGSMVSLGGLAYHARKNDSAK